MPRLAKRKPELTARIELTTYSDEHVYYEASMAIWTSQLLSVPFGALTKELAQILRFAVIESFATQVRNLVDFFYPRETVRATDVIAADYYVGGTLPTEFPPISPTLERARTRADKELAHLTTGRISGAPPEKDWPRDEIVRDLRLLLRRFVSDAQNVGEVLVRFAGSL
jgi:hypothetical protein